MKTWYRKVKKYNLLLDKLLKTRKYHFNKCNSTAVPRIGGIYVIYKKNEKIPLYVGIAVDLKRRLFHAHLKAMSQFGAYCMRQMKLEERKNAAKYIKDNCYFKYMPYKSENLKYLEHYAIAVLKPKWM